MTKRRDLERELIRAGWTREKGRRGSHEKFVKDGKAVMVPRHREIRDAVAAVIRREAGLA